MTDKDTITLPREVVEKIHEAWSSEVYPPAASTEWYDIMDALRTALAAEQPKPSGYAYRYADNVLRFNDGGWLNGWPPVEAVPYWFAPPALAAEQPAPTVKESLTHPGYVIGSHWLETAYSRICAGEAEADVLRDIGLVRITDGMVETADIHAIVDRQEALRLLDAERWRWHRAEIAKHMARSPESIDAAIDAAMEGKR